jgi:hypothetical protein
MSSTVRLALPAVPKVLSAAERTVQFIASSQALDCYRDIVRAAGWRFDRFQKNAPFVDSHNYASVGCLLGNVTGWQVQADKLVEDVKFIPEGLSGLADFAWKMVETGFLRAVSVGFMPLKVRSRWRDEKDFAAACVELGLSAEIAAQCACIHWEQDQTELSAVLIGANPEAVAKAHSAGALTLEDFAKLGVGEDDVSFIHEAADGWGQATPILRRQIRGELRAILGKTLTTTSPTTGNPPANQSKHADAAGNEKRAAQRKEVAVALRGFTAEINRCADAIPAEAQQTSK